MISSTSSPSPIAAAPAAAPRVAVLIPCHNEELTIAEVIAAFRSELPTARIYVCDNNSTDRTAQIAKQAGAEVMFEKLQGKGHVVQAMFRSIDADVYVMVDGDTTYPAPAVHALIEPILDNTADMVIGSRLQEGTSSDFRGLNRLGNRMYLFVLKHIFGIQLTDLLSGYRAFSRRFVSGTPLFSGGFDTEAEMTIRAIQRRFRVVEAPVNLRARPEGSESKIRIVRDGTLILKSMLALFRDYKPLSFFGALGLILVLLGLVPGGIVVVEYLRTGLIGKLPSAILAVGMVLTGVISIVVGVILHTIAQRFRELDFHLQNMADELRRSKSHNDAFPR
ncbi:MAG TPA: glycosyltransferase [Thermoanaerobaculia bacterium]|nr:glycosyltransferase [Thermoanaerobaculia bacterium]